MEKRRIKLYNQTLGKIGEQKACKYLKIKGYYILERNFRCKMGEIDIIAKDKNEIVFVEVKTRTSFKYGIPCEAINYCKRKHISRVARYYILKNSLEDDVIRFDAIEVIVKDKYYIHHIKEAF